VSIATVTCLLLSSCFLDTSPGETASATAGAEQIMATTSTTVAPSTTVATTSTSTSTTLAPTTTTGPTEWSLLVGGDVLMDRSEPAGVDVFAGIDPPLASADLSIVNVEMAISDRGSPVPGKQFVFRAPPSAATRIGDAGVDVASLGNNHARDFGGEALADTRELLEAAGVAVVGAGADRTAAFAPASFEIGDVSVAVVGISYIVPGGFGATSERSGIASGRDDSGADVAAVAVAAAEHDVVVAFVHWGIERRTCPSDVQASQADALFDAGATVVVGAHPHVLQPVERRDDGRVVVWSLGNFIWHPRSGITGDTAVVELSFVDDEVAGWTVHPHVLDGDGSPMAVDEGARHDRILDITGGECARHDPGPIGSPTTTAPPETTVAPTTTAPPETTVAPTTTAAPETTVAPETTAPPETTTAAPVEPTETAGAEPAPEPEVSGAVPPSDDEE
jgi:poly-gamma-glutamate synthesis protein (capsule biosynthesis protein)